MFYTSGGMPTVGTAALFLLVTAILSGSLGVVCALVYLRAGFRSTPSRKSRAEPLTPASDERLAKVEAEQAQLWSTLESLTTTLKRISSRRAMANLRGTPSGDEPPPPGTSKQDLRKFYGLDKLTPQEIADKARGN